MTNTHAAVVTWSAVVERIAAGSEAAIAELYMSLRTIRFFFERQIGPDRAEDAYHNLILARVRAIKQSGGLPQRHWIFLLWPETNSGSVVQGRRSSKGCVLCAATCGSPTCGRTARTTVSDPSSTSWLEAHTETLSNRLASPAATPALRGDKRMVRRAPPSELRPLTMAAAMAPVPMNPRIIEIYFIVPEGSSRRRTLLGS